MAATKVKRKGTDAVVRAKDAKMVSTVVADRLMALKDDAAINEHAEDAFEGSDRDSDDNIGAEENAGGDEKEASGSGGGSSFASAFAEIMTRKVPEGNKVCGIVRGMFLFQLCNSYVNPSYCSSSSD